MVRRRFSTHAALASMLVLFSTPVMAQTQARPATAGWTVPRTPDGQPDLQGIWTNATITPLERPRALAGKAFLTDAEAAALEKQIAEQRVKLDTFGTLASGSYNQFWYDAGTTVLSTRQTSLVVDPPDGRVPVRPSAEVRRDDYAARNADSYEFMSVWDRSDLLIFCSWSKHEREERRARGNHDVLPAVEHEGDGRRPPDRRAGRIAP